MRRVSCLLGGLVAVSAFVVGCSSSTQPSSSVPSIEVLSASTTAEVVSEDTQATTTSSSTTSLVTTTTSSDLLAEFDDDADLIMDLYAGWSQAVSVGLDEIEAYFAAHLYPDLPRCGPGEKTLPTYTAKRETIRRADEWAISWGPLDRTRPDGRVYEVQLMELDWLSHVSILHGVAYVFWNCSGEAAPGSPTTTPGVRYVVDRATYAPPSLPGSDGGAGSGCSPGTATLPNGVWFGFIDEAAIDRISFDLACIWPGQAYDDGLITNSSNRLRSVAVAPSAIAYQVVDAGGIEWIPMAYSEWLVAPPDKTLCSYPCDGAWLYVNDGAVTEVVQLFFP